MILTIRDHTRVVGACMNNVGLILQKLNTRQLIIKRQVPDPATVLKIVLAAPRIDRRTRQAIKDVLPFVSRFEAAQKALPRQTKAAISEISKQIDSQMTIHALKQTLGKLRQNQKYDKLEGLRYGLTAAIGMMEDGRSTIYSEDSHFNAVFDSSKTGKRILKASLEGLFVGGAVGAGEAGNEGSSIGEGAGRGAIAGAIGGALWEGAKIIGKMLC